MAGELLLDTGALVSLLDSSQPRHAEFSDFFLNWRGPVVSTEAVLTESTHPVSVSALRRCNALMRKYADLPMDYADASLVVLAEDLGTDLVFTTDDRDFKVYRIGRSRPFKLLPG